MKLAWIGSPAEGGGVGGMCLLFLRELTQMELQLDIYSENNASVLLGEAGTGSAIRFFGFPYTWNWKSWYGRNGKTAFIVSFVKRLGSYRRLVRALVAEHRREPYDAVLQFSQGELFALGKYASEIPIILFPCVHAAGELHWCRGEEHLARRCEPAWWRLVRDWYLAYRAQLQKRDYQKARGVIGMSKRFNAWVRRDYGLSAECQGVVYQPMEAPVTIDSGEQWPPVRPVRLLFVGRISVRKGIELLLKVVPTILSSDADTELTIIGAGSLWSNYEPLLADLPSGRCRWLKSLPNEQVTAEMQRSEILLVPSHYEPGGIVVAEALANGMIVVASNEVGSAENLPKAVCHEFPAGDADCFADAIVQAISKVRSEGPVLREQARKIARELFDPSAMARQLLRETERLVGKVPHGVLSAAR